MFVSMVRRSVWRAKDPGARKKFNRAAPAGRIDLAESFSRHRLSGLGVLSSVQFAGPRIEKPPQHYL
jgi:hypothetical protein